MSTSPDMSDFGAPECLGRAVACPAQAAERESGHVGAQATSSEESVPRRLGRFRVLRKLGAGGMGDVYQAEATGPAGFSKPVALKVIHAHLSDDPCFVEMFLDEARVGAKLSHPNIVATQDVFTDGDRYVLVMEYVEGVTLSRLQKRLSAMDESFPPALAAWIIAAVGEGLHAAHERGIIHRDISPQNIMLTWDGMPRLIDFGIAQADFRYARTSPGMIKGKVSYMAPEQLAGAGRLDHRVDVFALGVVLWEVCLGRRLFKGKNDLESAERVRACDVPRPSALDPKFPPGLEAVILKALQPNPDDRFASARAMARAIRRALADARDDVGPGELERMVSELLADERSGEVPGIASAAASPSPSVVAIAHAETHVREADRDASSPWSGDADGAAATRLEGCAPEADVVTIGAGSADPDGATLDDRGGDAVVPVDAVSCHEAELLSLGRAALPITGAVGASEDPLLPFAPTVMAPGAERPEQPAVAPGAEPPSLSASHATVARASRGGAARSALVSPSSVDGAWRRRVTQFAEHFGKAVAVAAALLLLVGVGAIMTRRATQRAAVAETASSASTDVPAARAPAPESPGARTAPPVVAIEAPPAPAAAPEVSPPGPPPAITPVTVRPWTPRPRARVKRRSGARRRVRPTAPRRAPAPVPADLFSAEDL